MTVAFALAIGALAAASLWISPDGHGAAGALLATLMLFIARSDWRRYRVPDRLCVLAAALRGLDIVLLPNGRLEAAAPALAGALVTSAAFYLFRASYGWIRGREGLGLGDVKLAGVAGAWVDFRLLPWVVEIAALFGLALALTRRRALRADSRLPFAVGFAPAIWLGWWLERLGY